MISSLLTHSKSPTRDLLTVADPLKISSLLTIANPSSGRFFPAAVHNRRCTPPPLRPLLRYRLYSASSSPTCSRSPRRPRSPPCSPSPTYHRGDSLPPLPATTTALLLHLSDLFFVAASAPLLLRRIPRHLHPRPRKKKKWMTRRPLLLLPLSFRPLSCPLPEPPPSPSVAPFASLPFVGTTSPSPVIGNCQPPPRCPPRWMPLGVSSLPSSPKPPLSGPCGAQASWATVDPVHI